MATAPALYRKLSLDPLKDLDELPACIRANKDKFTLANAGLGALREVPTLEERGMKGFEVKVWHGMYAPGGMPAPVRRMTDLSAD